MIIDGLVSILIQPEDRMQVGSVEPRLVHHVSILIQPEDRMQVAVVLKSRCTVLLFQSSSSPKTGCKRREVPHRDPDPVSILIQPEDRMQGPRCAA